MPARRLIAIAVATLLCLAAVAVPASAADPNHAPVAVDDPNPSCGIAAFGGMYPIPEDPKDPAVLAIGCAPLANDTDADGDILVPELVTDAEHGTATVWGDPDGTWNHATYLPDDDFNTGWGDQPGGSWESDHFIYRATDGTDWSEPAAYRVWIAPVNDPPTFTAGAALVEAQQDSGPYSGQWASAISPGPYEAYQHVRFEVTKVQVSGVPNLFAVNPAIDDDGVLTFTPGTHEYGLSQVTVRAVDDGGLEDWNLSNQLREQPDDTSDEVTFEIVVWPNHAPEASTDDIAVGQGAGPTSVDVLGNDSDSDGDALHVSAVTQGEHGAVAITGGGSALTYDPDGMYTGSDWFTYTVTDARGGTDTQFVTVTVVPDSTLPVVGGLTRSLPEQTIGASTVKVRLGWLGSDVGSGVASYRLERRVGTGAWIAVPLPSAGSTSVTTTVSLGTTYGFRVRATDGAGNVGAWVMFPSVTATRIQESSSAVAYTGVWTRITGPSLSGGSARYATASTRRAKLAFTGHEVALVATRRTTGGHAKVLIDGKLVATIDLDAAGTQHRRLVFRRAFAAGGKHTIEIRPVGDGRVEVDAFIVLR